MTGLSERNLPRVGLSVIRSGPSRSEEKRSDASPEETRSEEYIDSVSVVSPEENPEDSRSEDDKRSSPEDGPEDKRSEVNPSRSEGTLSSPEDSLSELSPDSRSKAELSPAEARLSDEYLS